jgi:hypothetical protein
MVSIKGKYQRCSSLMKFHFGFQTRSTSILRVRMYSQINNVAAATVARIRRARSFFQWQNWPLQCWWDHWHYDQIAAKCNKGRKLNVTNLVTKKVRISGASLAPPAIIGCSRAVVKMVGLKQGWRSETRRVRMARLRWWRAFLGIYPFLSQPALESMAN